ncbi:MAG: OmpH family outer membrane protein [Flavobacteriales bacterium]|nr:OmpH family outer membrane protein [Flavobacteriales bacterium]
MKKLVVILTLFAGILTAGYTQKFAYVDSEYILANLPEYTQAKFQLDQVAKKWQKEIEDKMSALDKDIKAYEAEKVLLTEDMRIKREKEIDDKRQAVLDLQKKRFGKEGDLFKKQQELIKPIQDKVYDAIKEVSDNKSYGIVFDKAGATTIMYASAKFDISDLVIRSMGYEPGANTAEPEDKNDNNRGGGIIQEVKEKSNEMFGSGSRSK